MNDKKFNLSLDDILNEMGIDNEIRKKRLDAITNKKTYNGINFIGNIDNKVDDNYKSQDFINALNLKNDAKKLNRLSNFNLLLFLMSIYILIANLYSLPLPSFLEYTTFPFIFTLSNLILNVLAIIISCDVIIDGALNILRPNINTLVLFSSITSVLHLISTIFLNKVYGYLPFTAVNIFILFIALKSFSFKLRAKSQTSKVYSMSSNKAYITTTSHSKNGAIYKTSDGNFLENHYDFSFLCGIYVVCMTIFAVLFAFYIAKTDISLFLYSLSAILSLSIPLNFLLIWSLPYKNLSNKLFADGIAIKSLSDMKKLSKCNYIRLDDNDLFEYGFTEIVGLKLLSSYSAESILALCYSGLKLANLSVSNAFITELTNRYIKPLKADKINEFTTNGFTFSVENAKVSLGNASYVMNLGIPLTSGSNVTYPIYVIIDKEIIAIVSIKYMASTKIFDMISKLDSESIKIELSTLDFNLKPSTLYDIFHFPEKNVVYPEFTKRYSCYNEHFTGKSLMFITRYSGSSFVKAILSAKRLISITKFNFVLGLLCLSVGILITSYLLQNFSPHLLLPQNIILFLFFWLVPSLFANFFIN